MFRFCALTVSFGLVASGFAADRFVVADRVSDVLWLMEDVDSDGAIDEPGEITVFFNNSNAAGTLGLANPNAMAIRSDGYAIVGDQLLQGVFALRDRNYDDDAQDASESRVVITQSNLSGQSFAFPTGAAFDHNGVPYVVNAGNAFGPDAVYRLVDGNNDGDYQDAGEILVYLGTGAFGPGNGPFSPQEIAFDSNNVGYLRNSSSGLHGVYRFVDANQNGRADDAGEFSIFANNSNADGVIFAPGFGLTLDVSRARSVYVLQIGDGSLDQIIRATDANNDGDAQDAGEVRIVYVNPQPGFNAIDVRSLPSGQLLVSETGLDQVSLLTDVNADGDFNDAGESRILFLNDQSIAAGTRQVEPLPIREVADLNCDGAATVGDIGAFVIALSNPANYFASFPNCNRSNADVNGDGEVTVSDIGAFIAEISG